MTTSTAPHPGEDTADLPDPQQAARLRRQLLAWYRKHRRRLPWRAAKPQAADPYRVLISEAMLQQTQVATVIPYFERFIEAFPNVEVLAAADEQQVLRLWQGLGYYRRARHLHAAARAIVERHGGRIPRTVEELLKLPGVGRYTAGAVASIAFGIPAPIVDGNVARVLARWFAIEEPVDDPRSRRRLWALAEALVPPKQPGDFNQAMMELGALICTPRSPRCLLCPVADQCEANRQGRQAELPAKGSRIARQAVVHRIIALERGGRFLFEQRPSDGLWANMWQMPTCEAAGDGLDVEAWVLDRYGLTIAAAEEISRFTHVTTHRDITFIVSRAKVGSGRRRPGLGAWRNLGNLDDLPLAKPQLKAVEMLKGSGKPAASAPGAGG